MDLRSFLLVSFVWTENKGAFTVTKKRQRLIPVALFPINYNKFLSDLRDESVSCACFRLQTLLLIRATSLILSLFCFFGEFTPDCIVLNSHSARATSQDHEHHYHKATARGGKNKLFMNYLWTNNVTFSLFFPACAKDPCPRKLLTGSCFVFCVATSPRDKHSAAVQTPSHLH